MAPQGASGADLGPRGDASGQAEIDAAGGRVPATDRDDFFCVRYAVWYNSVDCAFRTKYDTAPGCRGCEQGRFNLRRHDSRLGLPAWCEPLIRRHGGRG